MTAWINFFTRSKAGVTKWFSLACCNHLIHKTSFWIRL